MTPQLFVVGVLWALGVGYAFGGDACMVGLVGWFGREIIALYERLADVIRRQIRGWLAR